MSSQRARALTCGISVNSEARLGAFQAFCSRRCKPDWDARGNAEGTAALHGKASTSNQSHERRNKPRKPRFATAFILVYRQAGDQVCTLCKSIVIIDLNTN